MIGFHRDSCGTGPNSGAASPPQPSNLPSNFFESYIQVTSVVLGVCACPPGDDVFLMLTAIDGFRKPIPVQVIIREMFIGPGSAVIYIAQYGDIGTQLLVFRRCGLPLHQPQCLTIRTSLILDIECAEIFVERKVQ